jgi:hypothetical protein
MKGDIKIQQKFDIRLGHADRCGYAPHWCRFQEYTKSTGVLCLDVSGSCAVKKSKTLGSAYK